MEHTTVMVKEYANREEFATDELKLGQEGWSVQATVNPYQKQGLAQRLLARFSRKPAGLVITYTRPAPS